MKKPELFNEVIWNCTGPELFNRTLSDEEIDRIYEEVLKLTKKEYDIPKTFLDWRDITLDAMERLGYELAEK